MPYLFRVNKWYFRLTLLSIGFCCAKLSRSRLSPRQAARAIAARRRKVLRGKAIPTSRHLLRETSAGAEKEHPSRADNRQRRPIGLGSRVRAAQPVRGQPGCQAHASRAPAPSAAGHAAMPKPRGIPRALCRDARRGRHDRPHALSHAQNDRSVTGLRSSTAWRPGKPLGPASDTQDICFGWTHSFRPGSNGIIRKMRIADAFHS